MVKICGRETKMGKRKNQSIRYVQVEAGEAMCLHDEGRNVPCGESESFDRIIHGDALAELREYPADCVDLVFTSPPYADSRKKTYGGIKPTKYVGSDTLASLNPLNMHCAKWRRLARSKC